MQARLTLMMACAGTIAASQLVPGQSLAEPIPTTPPATATVTSNRPELESSFGWSDVSFELCSDPTCARVLDAWMDGQWSRVRFALTPGMYFWRVAYGPVVRPSGSREVTLPRGP